ncbi:MAG: BlaI/MecI/CopY family transcriptional regulator [Gemmatimonadota bacterium]|nr:BlaI/MecI/CopY family transcriptional regulator [Gemmatimonadota bacterium]
MRIAFTERELDVMTVLWNLGSATVSEVRDELKDDRAYTTVLTVLRTLEEKRYVRHEGDGRAHRYTPTVDRVTAGTSALRRMLSTVFGGSAELLLTNLVNDQKLTLSDIEQLRRLLNDTKPKRRRK